MLSDGKARLSLFFRISVSQLVGDLLKEGGALVVALQHNLSSRGSVPRERFSFPASGRFFELLIDQSCFFITGQCWASCCCASAPVGPHAGRGTRCKACWVTSRPKAASAELCGNIEGRSFFRVRYRYVKRKPLSAGLR